MKRTIVYTLFYIGHLACKLMYIKVSKIRYLFDLPVLTIIGWLLSSIYTEMMYQSDRLQDKWKVNGPWENTSTDNSLEYDSENLKNDIIFRLHQLKTAGLIQDFKMDYVKHEPGIDPIDGDEYEYKIGISVQPKTYAKCINVNIVSTKDINNYDN